MQNSYEAYGIHRSQWREIKNRVIDDSLSTNEIKKAYDLNSVQVWFLFEKLLQGEFNHLYKRSNLEDEDIKVGQFVFCNYPQYGRGEIVVVFRRDPDMPKAAKLMEVKFVERQYPTMCDYDKKVTVHDGVKRKITRL